MPRKQLVFYGLMALLVLCILEAASSVFYFQGNASEPLALFHYARRISRLGQQYPGLQAVGIWQFDERYGFSHIAQTTGTHETEDYTVT